MNNNVSISPTSESVRNRPLKKSQIIKKQSRALSRSLISEYPGHSLISEPITAREKHYSLVGYMLTVDIYFLLSNQSTRKVLFTCLANTNYYSMLFIYLSYFYYHSVIAIFIDLLTYLFDLYIYLFNQLTIFKRLIN